MSNGGPLEDYVDVAERILAFKAQHPDGSLQTDTWDVLDVGGRAFIVYSALAYRTPDDPRPGQGTAWEPFPGPTPFTRDSELMNAETAAWGRAIVAVGITASRKLATRQEVEARTGTPAPENPAVPAAQPDTHAVGRRGPSTAQKIRIKNLVQVHGLSRTELSAILGQWEPTPTIDEGWIERLTPGRDGTASRLIDILSRLDRPQVDAEQGAAHSPG